MHGEQCGTITGGVDKRVDELHDFLVSAITTPGATVQQVRGERSDEHTADANQRHKHDANATRGV